jgi:arylsulfatase
MQLYTVEAKQTPSPGKHTVKFDFAYDGGGVGKGGMRTLFIDGVKEGEGRIERTQPGIFSADETADVGIDLATPVVDRIGAEPKSKLKKRTPKLVVEVK